MGTFEVKSTAFTLRDGHSLWEYMVVLLGLDICLGIKLICFVIAVYSFGFFKMGFHCETITVLEFTL